MTKDKLMNYSGGAPATLDELYDAMRHDDPALPSWDSLPTFGGVEPVDTTEIWSWDKTRLIVGTCSHDIRIVERRDHLFV